MNLPGEGVLRRARQFLLRDLWSPEFLADTPVAWARNLLQLAVAIGLGFIRDHLLLRASALTFYTMLSLVPLLAIALSLIEALGFQGDLVEVLLRRAAVGSPEAVDHIMGIVGQVNFAGLGTLGAAMLIVTTVLAVGNVEKAFNEIWRIRRARSLSRRFPDYLAVVVVTPLLIGVAISLATSLRSQAVLRWIFDIPALAALWDAGLRHLPTLLLVSGFGFLYWFLPNTQVRIPSAFLGALVAGGLFLLAQTLFLGLNVGVTRYNTLFGGLAFLPLLLLWVYLSWAVVLLGAEVAFAHQNLAVYRREVAAEPPGPAAREAMGLAIAAELARRFRDGAPPWEAEEIADSLVAPLGTVRELLASLEGAGIVSEVAGDRREGAYQLARAAERTSLAGVLDVLRGPRDVALGDVGLATQVSGVLAEVDSRQRETTERETLADLVARLPASR